MRIRPKRHILSGVYRKYFLRYFAVFMLILIPSIAVEAVSHQNTLEQVLETSQIQFEDGVQRISSEIDKATALQNYVLKSAHFQELARFKDSIPWGKYMNLQYAKQELNNMRFLCNLISGAFCLFESNDCIVTTYQCDERFSSRYYGTMMQAWYQGEELSAEGLKELIFGNQNRIYYFIRLDKLRIHLEQETVLENPILMVVNRSQSLTYSEGLRTCYIFPAKAITEALLTDENKVKGCARIIDSDSQMIYSYGSAEELPGYGESSAEGKEYWVLSSLTVGTSNWKIQIGIHKSIISDKLRVVRVMFYAYTIAGIILVLLLSTLMGRKQFEQFRKVYSVIPQNRWDRIAETRQEEGMSDTERRLAIRRFRRMQRKNEYEVLTGIFSDLAENSERYLAEKEALEKQKRDIRLEQLIIEGANTKDEYEELADAQLISSEYYCAADVRLTVNDAGSYGAALLALNEYLQKNWKGRIFHTHVKIYEELFIVPLEGDDADQLNVVKELFEDAARLISAGTDVRISVGISTVGADVTNLKECYMRARQVLEAYYNPERNDVHYYQIRVDELPVPVASIDYLNQLDQYISYANEEGVHKCFLLLKAYYRNYPLMFEAQKEQLFYTIRNILYNRALALLKSEEEIKLLPVYHRDDSADDLSDRLETGAQGLVEIIKKERDEEKNAFQDEVLRFLEKNYTDKNMSLDMVCSCLGISERYLQTIIKDQTGDTFNVYLEKLRVAQAAELLLHTELSNEQIADRVGFSAISTFYRVFNKRMGMSPKAFRKG